MKKYIIYPTLFFLCTIMSFNVHGQSIANERRWQNVEKFANDQLPESALSELDLIFVEAKKQNNVPELIKANIYKMRFTLEKDANEAPNLIREFQEFSKTVQKNEDKALLHSMTAELYYLYYQASYNTVNQRTEITGYVPQEITEWSKNIFVDTISSLLQESLEKSELLQTTPVSSYALLLTKDFKSGESEKKMFEFLAQRRIEILENLSSFAKVSSGFKDEAYFAETTEFVKLPLSPFFTTIERGIVDTYQQLLKYNLKSDDVSALIINDLNRLSYINSFFSTSSINQIYVSCLEQLKKKYVAYDACAEVYIRQVQYYTSFSDYDRRQVYDLCQAAIIGFPSYKGINNLKNIQAQISQKTLNLVYKQVVKPKQDAQLSISSKNVDAVQLNVYKVDATPEDYYSFRNNYRNNDSLYAKKSLVHTYNITIEKNEDFKESSTPYTIKLDDYGIYEFLLQYSDDAGNKTIGAITVSDFAFISRQTETDFVTMYVLDRVSGHLQTNVNVKTYKQEWNRKEYQLTAQDKGKTDKTGLYKYKSASGGQRFIVLEKGTDKFFSSESYNYFSNPKISENENLQIALLTDRSVYRPGQTVYFKGIAYYSTLKKEEVAPAQPVEVQFIDANYQQIASSTFTTNEFGSFSGSFIVPQSVLSGTFTLRSGNANTSVLVEEYKRPTFEAKLNKPASEVRFDDLVTLKGNAKAYAGYPVSDAQVSYRVVRTPHYFWRLPFYMAEEQVASGVTNTDGKGDFELSFTPQKSNQPLLFGSDQFFSFTVYADITDTKGETQQAVQTMAVGDKSLFINNSLADKVNKDSVQSITLTANTLNGEEVSASIHYTVYSLQASDEYVDKKDGIIDISYYIGHKKKESRPTKAKVFSGDFQTNSGKLALDFRKLASGEYKIVFQTKDAFGKEVESEKEFVLYGLSDKKPPVKSYVWTIASKTECNVNEKAQIRFGTSAQKVSVLYEIMQGTTILESKWITLSNEIRKFEIPYLNAYGAGVNVNFTFVKDEQLFVRTVQLTKKTTPKVLNPKLTVFRDKLKPGETAEWTITVPESAGKQAELLASMYDASLDVFRKHQWYFSPAYRERVQYSPNWEGGDFSIKNLYLESDIPWTWEAAENPYSLNWFGLYFYSSGYGNIRFRGSASLAKSNVSIAGVVLEESVAESDIADMASIQFSPPVPAKSGEIYYSADQEAKAETSNVQIRSNFSETAFFYPQLKTDAEGNVKFSFTVPESLTRWNVNLLAHTKDLYFGQSQEQVITQKELMVQMNIPRFVRRSDKLVVSANVINLTDKALTAQVYLELINPETEQLISIKDNDARSITLKANETASVEWEVSEFDAYELLVCKVIAEAGDFSDGEQHYLPVLPDKILLTEALPLIVRGNETRNFEFENLAKNYNKVETQHLSVEFSSNPTWYAVQALPTLAVPENSNAIDYFTAYYANTLATHIANSTPKIATVFERWKQAGGSRDALLSDLEQNTELKNILLQETPWVMDAQNESEQKRRIALLFDLNMQKQQNTQYWEKLLELQKSSGGFAWFEGMSESRYITQSVLLDYARLNNMLGTATDTTDDAIRDAVRYIDLAIERDYDYLKSKVKNYKTTQQIGNMQWFYLHVRSMYSHIPIEESAVEAVNYYTKQAETYWKRATLYGKAATAIIANYNGNIVLRDQILKSLKENAKKTDEMGMYWANNTNGYFWHERPVMVHTALMEAFALKDKKSSDMEEMKIWLLKQKQTQVWDSPASTVDAVYALLHYGNDWLASQGDVKIKVGNAEFKPQSQEAGTGYFKQSIVTGDINKQTANITVTKNDPNIGWGAMYWQFYQDIVDVKQSGGALNVTKKLFVERLDDISKTILPIEQVSLKKGDKIITRLVVTTDRDLEFVALKDGRSACLEPVEQVSRYVWRQGLGYYQTTKDASTQFFFSNLPKGNYVFEYESWVNNAGEFVSGVTEIQCLYAPEFVSHSGGERIKVIK